MSVSRSLESSRIVWVTHQVWRLYSFSSVTMIRKFPIVNPFQFQETPTFKLMPLPHFSLYPIFDHMRKQYRSAFETIAKLGSFWATKPCETNHWSSSPFPLPSSVSWNTFLWALTPKAHLNWHSSLILYLKVQFLWNLFFKIPNELQLLQIFWDYTVLDYIFVRKFWELLDSKACLAPKLLKICGPLYDTKSW